MAQSQCHGFLASLSFLAVGGSGQQEPVKESAQPLKGIKWHNISDILIGSDDDQASVLAVNLPHVKNIVAGPLICAKGLFIVNEPKASLLRPT